MDKKFAQRFWAKVDRKANDECWLWKGAVQSSGYGTFWKDGKNRLVHRISYGLSRKCGPAKTKVVRHKCNTRLCVNPSHLLIGTHKDNFNDAVACGKSGAASPTINRDQVIMVRWLATLGWTRQALANACGVSKRCIAGVVRRETWKEVK